MSSTTTSSSTSSSTARPMSSSEIVAFYTADLMLGRNPAKALQRLYTHGVTMKPFVDAGTEQLLSKYDDDYTCRQPLQMLREKFACLRRREAQKRIAEEMFENKTIIEKKNTESSMSQESTNDLFSTALRQVSSKKTEVKRVDYSKFKVVKRKNNNVSVQTEETPKNKRTNVSRLRNFSFSSSVYSWSSESSDTSPEYQ